MEEEINNMSTDGNTNESNMDRDNNCDTSFDTTENCRSKASLNSRIPQGLASLRIESPVGSSAGAGPRPFGVTPKDGYSDVESASSVSTSSFHLWSRLSLAKTDSLKRDSVNMSMSDSLNSPIPIPPGRPSWLLSESSIGMTTCSPVPSSKRADISIFQPTYESRSSGNDSVSPSIIHDEARIGNWDTVQALVRSHPSAASYRCLDGLTTALHHVCTRRCHRPEVFESLIQANPRALVECDEKGWTPLHHAARFKAPREAVRLLLHSFPEMGMAAASKRCKSKGRTPLYYAIRYDAPDGVVGMLLDCMSKEDILDEDKQGSSCLGLVWDQWAGSSEGKRVLAPYLKVFDTITENSQNPDSKTPSITIKSPSLKKRWDQANILLKGAFRFSPQEGKHLNETSASCQQKEEPKGTRRRRKWRVLHATSAVKCHPSLFKLACVLHPEQAREIDEGDLYGFTERTNSSGSFRSAVNMNANTSALGGESRAAKAKRTALHFAAAAPTQCKFAADIISTLLALFPEAASMPNPADGSLPLHYLCENESKNHWIHSGISQVYDAYPNAARYQDLYNRTPLHRAAAVICSRQQMPSSLSGGNHNSSTLPQPLSGSILSNLVELNPRAASLPDVTGKLPLHYIAELAETWDDEVESLRLAYPKALQTRAGSDSNHVLPLHLASLNPDAKDSLLETIVRHHPRAAMQTDGEGNFPLHLACEAGKTWEGGMQTICEAYPDAIKHTVGAKNWTLLHFAAACPNSSPELLEILVKLYARAATMVDSEGRLPLHLAVESCKEWDLGLETLFRAFPEAIEKEDFDGKIPLACAALRYSGANSTVNNTSNTSNEVSRRAVTPLSSPKNELSSASESPLSINNSYDDGDSPLNFHSSGITSSSSKSLKIRTTSTSRCDSAVMGGDLSHINVLFHLLVAAPHVIQDL